MKEIVSTKAAPAAIGPYSQGVVAGQGFVLYISGQLPVDPVTGEFPGKSIQEQTRQSILNLKAILQEKGCSLEHVIKTTVFLKDMGDFSEMNQVYAEYFSEKSPARSTIQVAALPKDASIEIEAVAVF